MASRKQTESLKPSKTLEANQLFVIDRWFDLARRAMNWLGVIGSMLVVGWWIKLISGRATYFELATKIITDFKLNEWFAWGVAALFGLNSWRLSKARKGVIERYHPYRKAFEESVDQKRTSSGESAQSGIKK